MGAYGAAPADVFEQWVFSALDWQVDVSVGGGLPLIVASACGTDYGVRGIMNTITGALEAARFAARNLDDTYRYDYVQIAVNLVDAGVMNDGAVGWAHVYDDHLGGSIFIDASLGRADVFDKYTTGLGEGRQAAFGYVAVLSQPDSWRELPRWDITFTLDIVDTHGLSVYPFVGGTNLGEAFYLSNVMGDALRMIHHGQVYYDMPYCFGVGCYDVANMVVY